MTVPRYLRLAFIAALIGFTGRADAACLATGAMPTAQHASDCADVPGRADHEPTGARGQPSAAPCPFACVTLTIVAACFVSAPVPASIAATPIRLSAMSGGRDPPPTPPPRPATKFTDFTPVMENDMKKTIIIAALAIALPGVAHAADTPAPQKECCCCKKGEDGKMACCKDKDAKPGEQGHEGHDMKGMSH